MKEINLKKIKQLQLELLLYIEGICNLYHLSYSLCGGTLIGAVRHGGFIPWDDDIDIILCRNDYDKLLNILQNINDGSYYKLLTYNSEGYYFPFSKLVDRRTKLIENDTPQIPELGVFIDIFPIDTVHDNFIKRNIQFKKHKCYDFLLWKVVFKKCKSVNQFKKNFILKCILKKMDKNMKKNETCKGKMSGCFVGRYGGKEFMESDLFVFYSKIRFEEYEFSCLSNYHQYLSNIYNDYMKIPESNNQISNHFFKAYWIES